MYMTMQRWKRVTARCLLLLCAAAIALPAQAARADEVNLALNKSVEVTREHEGSAKKLVDGDKTKAGRWMTEAPATDAHSAIVDLQKVEKVNFFEITWEDETNCGADFKLYASKDKEDWGAPIKEWKGSKGAVTLLKLDVPVGQFAGRLAAVCGACRHRLLEGQIDLVGVRRLCRQGNRRGTQQQ